MYTPSGTRTHNLTLRRGAPYPLGHGGGDVKQNVVPRVGFEPTHSLEYLNLSQAP